MSRLLDVYEGVESLYMSDYHAVVELDALPGDGTRIRWHGTYTVPSEMREDFQGYLGGIMQDMANGLAAQAALPAEGPVERQPVLGQRGEAPLASSSSVSELSSSR